MFESGKIMSSPSCQKHVGLSNIINLGFQMLIGFSNSCDVSTRGRRCRGRRDHSMPSLGTFVSL